MNTINRMMANLLSEDLAESKAFYTTLFDFEVDFDSDWFVHLISKSRQLELGIISKTSDIVPADIQGEATGFYLTLVTENADKVFEIAQEKGFEVASPPEDTFYGQRRLLLKDPNGTIVDVSSPIPHGGI